jgi:hypothetical protein
MDELNTFKKLMLFFIVFAAIIIGGLMYIVHDSAVEVQKDLNIRAAAKAHKFAQQQSDLP